MIKVVMFDEISIISAMRLIEGGAAIFAADIINQASAKEGNIIIVPLLSIRLREEECSYSMFAPANNADLRRPWANIIDSAPHIPQDVLVIMPAKTRAMCPTEEYAIKDFRSGCRTQIKLVIIPPQRVREIIVNFRDACGGPIMDRIRIIPYPPSFKRIAAKIIDPATGASTWAFGSHKWVKNIGSFTINARFNKIQCVSLRLDVDVEILNIFMLCRSAVRNDIIMSNGRLAVMVYIIKYMPA